MEQSISSVSTPDLIDQITELAGHLNAAHARWLALIAEFDRRRGWAEWGVKSCAHWLNWQCGIGLGAAREKLRVGHALEELPSIASAMAEGKLSYSKARAMTRVADETNEKYLLNIAISGTANHVEKVVQSYRRAKDSQELAGGDRQQIVLHVDAQTLKHDHAGQCELEHGPALAAETARRLSCDASLVAIIENEQGEPLTVGRKTRTIPPAIRMALNSRDKGCPFPGCSFTRYVDGHHVKHWAHGGETSFSNLVTLCRFHHRLVHEGQVVV